MDTWDSWNIGPVVEQLVTQEPYSLPHAHEQCRVDNGETDDEFEEPFLQCFGLSDPDVTTSKKPVARTPRPLREGWTTETPGKVVFTVVSGLHSL